MTKWLPGNTAVKTTLQDSWKAQIKYNNRNVWDTTVFGIVIITLVLAKVLVLMLSIGTPRCLRHFEVCSTVFVTILLFSVLCVSNRHHAMVCITLLKWVSIFFTLDLSDVANVMDYSTRKEVVPECGWSKPCPFQEYTGCPDSCFSSNHAHRMQLS